MKLEGRTALVTGAGRGIGAETARALARAGARVTVAARSRDEVEETARSIRDLGGEALVITCDVTDERQVDDMVAASTEAWGPTDILVNNAGTSSSNPLHRVTLGEWRRVMDVNATGTFLCTRAVLPEMVGRGYGRIVNVASVAGLEGAPYISAYTAAKHAVIGFTRAIAAEVASRGVTVNAVCPGYVDTPMTDATVDNVARRTGTDRDTALARVLEHAGQPRLITTREVADAVVALCVAAGLSENGQAVRLDGSSPFPSSRP